MLVGFMRNFKKPTYMAKLTAMLCNSQGIDLIYLKPSGVNVETDRVEGMMYIDNKWVKVEADLPQFIDISPYCFKAKNKNIITYLRNNTLLSDDRRKTFSKEKVQSILKNDEKFAHLVIPTLRAQTFQNVIDFIDKYDTIVMKPIKGERGKGVYILRKERGNYILGYEKEEKKLTQAELKVYFDEITKNKRYIIQKYITSKTKQGDPFDCRVHVEKNGKGQWVSARNFIRVGIGQKVISNVNQGGGISDPEPFLKANFGDQWKEINNKLNALATSLPYKMENLRNTKVMSMGLDVGIDKDGEIYLFEINGAPVTAPLRSEAAMLRTQYYKYLLLNNVKGNLNTSKVLNNDYEILKKDFEQLKVESRELKKKKESYKKKYQAIINSRTWRFTGPIRKVSSLTKRIVQNKE